MQKSPEKKFLQLAAMATMDLKSDKSKKIVGKEVSSCGSTAVEVVIRPQKGSAVVQSQVYGFRYIYFAKAFLTWGGGGGEVRMASI